MSKLLRPSFALNLRARLLLRLVAMLVFLLAMGAVGIVNLRHADSRIVNLVDGSLGPAADAGRIQNDYNSSLQVLTHAVLSQLPSAVEEAHTRIHADRFDVERHWKPLLASALAQQEAPSLKLAARHRDDADKAVDETLQLLDAGQFELASLKLSTEVQPAYQPLQSDFANLFESALNHGKEQVKAQRDADRRGVIMLIAGMLLALCATLVMDGLFMRSLLGRLALARSAASRIAEGDIGVPFEPGARDELGDLLRALAAMDAQLLRVIGQVREGARSVDQRAHQLAHDNLALSERTRAQSVSVQATADAMGQLGALAGRGADHARHAGHAAKDAEQDVAGAHAIAGDAQSSMSDVIASGQRIAAIVDLVDSIAFQTNLLALNAAIEAAHAGDNGRGFAVVAGEVRQLAQRCQEAGRQIRQMIESTSAAADAARERVHASGEALDAIARRMLGVTGQLARIDAATGEQVEGVGQMSAAVERLDQITRANTGLVERINETGAALARDADRLMRQVAFFRLSGPGDAGTTVHEAPSHELIRDGVPAPA
ncbi:MULTISPECIES: methyl-accepting chemotaxis protein [Dyella]|uniref:HAMP domain-containing protein n=2 Tax=Dyella TaxID=231454 RepID=A0A4V2NMB9_9GAMM|nr:MULTISPECIES: methyl-accepting chemotaxis protein [Dyella]TBR39701.1 HAMP domain-containing protein [Dyella terrae]TCI12717.1 HAMP domain-containing protein [Dyella soli]